MVNFLMNQDDGNYFNQDGTISDGTGLEYIKSRNFELKPELKGPRDPNDRNPAAIFSIDGEEYPA
jgi:hypothetical protein